MVNTRISLHVGVNGYPPALGPLRFCAADATAVRKILDSHREGFHSTRSVLLADGPVKGHGDAQLPTRANIMTSIQQACTQATEQDTLLLQFSGHGALAADGRLYLLPSDVVPSGLEFMGISWQWLSDTIEQSRAKNKIVILDACHSGAGKDASVPNKKTAAILGEVESRSNGFVCLSSCSGGELAYELPELEHGIFSYYLVSGITGAADPLRRGVIDMASLYAFARERTIQEARKLGASQHPHLITKVAAPLESFVITAMPLDRTINRVLILSENPLWGSALKVAISRSKEVGEAVWKNDVRFETDALAAGFDYSAVYVDVMADWEQKKQFIVQVRQKYPIVPFVLFGSRDAFLSSLSEPDRKRFEHYFFFDIGEPMSAIPRMVAETLGQIDWDITKRYGEGVEH
jgi:hypothetical protein